MITLINLRKIAVIAGLFISGLWLVSGCNAALTPALDPPAAEPVDGSAGTPPPCPVSAPSKAPPTDTDVFADGAGAEWFCSPDNELCVVKNGLWSAGGLKVGWRKPQGAQLEITGRRLDTAGPPLGASVPDGYDGHFQASGLIFPTGGCWQVEGRAKKSALRFVVEVEPAPQRPRGGGCDTLAEVVQSSDGVIVGQVVESQPGPEGRYVWHSVRPRWNIKHPYNGGVYTGLELLQDTREGPALQADHFYLLFLQGDPFRILCPRQTLAEVTGDTVEGEVIRLNQASGKESLWSGKTPAEIAAEIKR